MKLGRILAGLSLFCSSCWLGPAVASAFGFSELFGFVTAGSILAFLGGALFWSGVTKRL